MTSLPELCTATQRTLGDACDRVAGTIQFVKRRSKLTPSQLVQTLVFGWLSSPQATLEQLTQMSAALGVPVSPQAIDQRFTLRTAELLRGVLREAVWEKVSGVPAGIDLLDRFTEVSLIDSSQVSLPPELAGIWRGNGRGTPKAAAKEEGKNAASPATVPEATVPEATAPEATAPEATAPEATVPEATAPEATAADRTGSRAQEDRREDRTEAAIKIHLRFELREGTLEGLELTDGREADRNAHLVVAARPKGSLEIRDRGYFRLDQLAHEHEEGKFWITRFQANAGFRDEAGTVWEIGAYLKDRPKASFDHPIFLGLDHRIPSRLIGAPAPADVAEARRRQLRRDARAKGRTPTDEQLALCDWNVWVTNVPVEQASIAEVIVLARLRWQIELMFKLWKSGLLLDEWRTKKTERILCELYAKLMGALLQHWVLVVCGWDDPNRSLFKAAQTLRQFALQLALALGNPPDFCRVLARLRECLSAGCHLNKRAKRPSSSQLLAHPDLGLN